MWPTYWHAVLACLAILKVGSALANPQQAFQQQPNGNLVNINNQFQNLCGSCPATLQRETVRGPYCGRCVPQTQTCANGYYPANGGCTPCPCPEANGARRFGTSCRVDVDGQVTCDCPNEYRGRDCSLCAPGTVQNNQYPYSCIAVNSTNSFSTTCYNGNNQCKQLQVGQILQRNACNNNNCDCRGNGCQNTCCGCTPPPPPTTPAPWTPPPPTTVCPGPVICPPPKCNTCNPCGNGNNGGCTPCTGNGGCSPCNGQGGGCTPCTGNGNNGGCKVPTPCTGNGQNGGCTPCTGNGNSGGCTPCTGNGQNGGCSPCTGNGCTPCNGNGNGQNGGCTPCTGNGNSGGCNPCGNGNTGGCSPCQTPCNQGCNQCQTPITCKPCPTPEPCKPCDDRECNICPNPCQECPNPCKQCPEIPGCPACNLTCGPCICEETPGRNLTIIENCICDPRGTATQLPGDQCLCKVNVQGATCDQCKPGYFGLSSSRPEGCISCFCSGLSTSCSLTPYFSTKVGPNRNDNCSVELTDERHTVVYSKGSSGFVWDGTQATFTKQTSGPLFWSLPACLKGDRVTSYGGLLSFSRMCSGGSSSLGVGHEVVLVSGSDATVFWTTFNPQACNGQWAAVDVLLAESAYWTSWKGEQARRATRGDIMEVLADLQLILIRATFSPSISSTAIKDISLSTVTTVPSREGIAMHVESCQCPIGYRGHSCENCAPGYFRDVTDMSKSVFGACKRCPCSETAEGCHLSDGQVVCVCKPGFSGPRCQDRESICVSCDPFYIREVEGVTVDFTCNYTTDSKRALLLRFGNDKAEDTRSITKSIKLDRSLRKLTCEVLDTRGEVWATVHCGIEVIPKSTNLRPPPPPILSLIPDETSLCVEEGKSVTLRCNLHSFGPGRVTVEWRKEGDSQFTATGTEYRISSAVPNHAGTYICYASDRNAIGMGQIALMVRRIGISMRSHYPLNITGGIAQQIYAKHGGDYPNYPYQRDQTVENDTNDSQIISQLPEGYPKARVDPVEIKAKVGDTVILRCNATGKPELKFYWRSLSRDYMPVHARISHGALIFRQLKKEDAGVYICKAWNHLGESTARATIYLEDPEKPKVEILHPEIRAKAGENVNFQCRCNQTGVMYEWSRVGEMMPNSSEVRADGLLTLYRVSESNQGKYVCTVTDLETGVKTEVEGVLYVRPAAELKVPPRVTVRPKSPLFIRKGKPLRLECESTGSPMPNITWQLKKEGSTKVLGVSNEASGVYEIKKMSKSDDGVYTCVARSSSGTESKNVVVVIADEPPCQDNEFRCKSGNQCVLRLDRCDGKRDCKDGSDEGNCKKNG